MHGPVFEPPAVIERVLRGETITVEMMHRRKDGSLFMSEVCARLIESQGRRLVVAHERDISRRKRVEPPRQRERRLLAAILDNIPRASSWWRRPMGDCCSPTSAPRTRWDARSIPPREGATWRPPTRPSCAARRSLSTERMPVVRGPMGETSMVEDMEIERPDGRRPCCRSPVVRSTRAGEVAASVVSFRTSPSVSRRKDGDGPVSRLNSLLELSQRSLDLSEGDIVQQAIEEAVSLTGSEIGYLHFVNPDQRSIKLKTWSRGARAQCTAVAEDHYPLDQAGVWADCVRLGRPVIHNAYQSLPDRKGYPEGHSHVVRHASAPIFDGGRAAIIIGVGNKAQDYDDSDVRQLILIGDQILRILQRKRAEEGLREANRQLLVQLEEIGRLQAELRDQAAHDPLTGLLNRRSMNEELERELIRAARERHPIAVVMLDVDQFKSINDALGHQAWDAVLTALGTLLRAQTRRTDAVCRLGGDEFLVLMPRASCRLAAERAEQWRWGFAALAIPFGNEALRATLSIGVADLPPGTSDVDAVLRQADSALYQSKAAGRNRVTTSAQCTT
jgi:diguanylate cyclase (GGDEF)-like protein